jgi:hypothetical protein
MRAIPSPNTFRFYRFFAVVIVLALLAAPLRAQQPSQSARTAPPTPAEADPTFDSLLATDAYKLYGEVRNVGTLLSSGGAGEIVDPIIKLADPGPQFKSIVSFLKKNSEALGSSRLMFAGWPARTDVPAIFFAIEFPTNEDANKFAPKLETFLPTILPPVPDATPESSSSPSAQNEKAAPKATPVVASSPRQPPAEHLPFVITHRGNLVFISDKSFKFEKLHPASSKPLFQDPNFRLARDQFASESIFLFMNVELEDKTIPKPSPTPVLSDAEKEQMRREQEEEQRKQQEEMRAAMEAENNRREQQRIASGSAQPSAVLTVQALPTPTPNKEQQAQRIATSQIGSLLDSIGYGEPTYPDAVGFALSLDGNEYILRAILVDKPDAKKVLIPFIPQLQSGPPITADAASVLPDDTEILVSASVDLAHTYEGMRKAAEVKAKTQKSNYAVYKDGVQVKSAIDEPSVDAFTQFEKKAAFNIKDDLLPALGNEIALAGSLKALQGAGGLGLGLPMPPPRAAATEPGADKDNEKDQKSKGLFPMLLIEVKDRDAARRLMPRVLDGLGIGEANLLAQTEKREDTEMVNYAGIFAYAFVGNFVVISDAPTVRRVIDANVNHQTLSSNTVFRNSRRWQSRGTLGQIYVSPALMEGYQDEVRKQAANMEVGLRDFLLGLNPNSESITYAVSNDGLGTQHELHLPKNLILMMVAGISSATKNPPPEQNEMIAGSILGFVVNLEEEYKKGPGKGSYGSMQQLADAKLFQPDQFDRYGYKFDIVATGDSFEATAIPREYGKTGKRSFFVDKSGIVRGDDHGGAPATAADKPIQQ